MQINPTINNMISIETRPFYKKLISMKYQVEFTSSGRFTVVHSRFKQIVFNNQQEFESWLKSKIDCM